METKHTKGEWTTQECSSGGLIVCLGDQKDWSAQRVQIANEANAKLIAAAADLLEALIVAKAILNLAYPLFDEWPESILINKAIEKATK